MDKDEEQLKQALKEPPKKGQNLDAHENDVPDLPEFKDPTYLESRRKAMNIIPMMSKWGTVDRYGYGLMTILFTMAVSAFIAQGLLLGGALMAGAVVLGGVSAYAGYKTRTISEPVYILRNEATQVANSHMSSRLSVEKTMPAMGEAIAASLDKHLEKRFSELHAAQVEKDTKWQEKFPPKQEITVQKKEQPEKWTERAAQPEGVQMGAVPGRS